MCVSCSKGREWKAGSKKEVKEVEKIVKRKWRAKSVGLWIYFVVQ